MTILPPSPFLSADDCELPAGTAAAQSSSPGAAAEALTESSTATGGHQEASPAINPHELAGGLLAAIEHDLDHRFVLNEARFLEDIEEMPLFLRAG